MKVVKKRLAAVFFAMLLMLGTGTVFAEEIPQKGEAKAVKPVIATIYINNAKTTYDDEISKQISNHFNSKLAAFTLKNDHKIVEKLNKAGVADLSMAARDDILQALGDEDVDYLLYAEIQPPVTNSWMSMYCFGAKATIVMPVKIIDVKKRKYLYNGKFVENADNSSVLKGHDTKAAFVRALEFMFVKIDIMLNDCLPTQ